MTHKLTRWSIQSGWLGLVMLPLWIAATVTSPKSDQIAVKLQISDIELNRHPTKLNLVSLDCSDFRAAAVWSLWWISTPIISHVLQKIEVNLSKKSVFQLLKSTEMALETFFLHYCFFQHICNTFCIGPVNERLPPSSLMCDLSLKPVLYSTSVHMFWP